MAFNGNNITPLGGNSRAGKSALDRNAPMGWAYQSKTDDLSTILGTGYFDTFHLSLVAGQFIYVSLTDQKAFIAVQSVDHFLKQVFIDTVIIGGGGDALTANPLSQFADTTSAELAGIMTNAIEAGEPGAGKLVFSDKIPSRKPINVIEVFQESDFGLNVSGVVSLIGGTTYVAMDTITLGALGPIRYDIANSDILTPVVITAAQKFSNIFVVVSGEDSLFFNSNPANEASLEIRNAFFFRAAGTRSFIDFQSDAQLDGLLQLLSTDVVNFSGNSSVFNNIQAVLASGTRWLQSSPIVVIDSTFVLSDSLIGGDFPEDTTTPEIIVSSSGDPVKLTQIALNSAAVGTKAMEIHSNLVPDSFVTIHNTGRLPGTDAVAPFFHDETGTVSAVADGGVNVVDNNWTAVTFDNGLFVAVSVTGVDNRVITSPDGIIWTSRLSAADNDWRSITFGNGLFVAVADTGTNNRVMTSPNGIDWTSRVSATDFDWNGVTFGNGLFVAVSSNGTNDRVMISSDGINWFLQSDVPSNFWESVTFGNGRFVAVASSGTGDRVMTSLDGETWTSRSSAADNNWTSVTFGNGRFVAVASGTGVGNRVMTSPDGITWTIQSSVPNNLWFAVTFGNGLFVAVASGAGNLVMTSPNGVDWTSRVSASDNNWFAVTFGNGRFVAVSTTGTGLPVMTSPDGINWTSNSRKMLVTAAGHNVQNADTVTHTLFDDFKYNGDFITSNVIAGVSYKVAAPFDEPSTGTWTNFSLTQKDPRITSTLNQKIKLANSMTQGEARTNVALLNTSVQDVAVPLIDDNPAPGDWIEDSSSERVSVDITTGVITYKGILDTAVDVRCKIFVPVTSNGNHVLHFYLHLNGAQQAKTKVIIDTADNRSGSYVGGIFKLSTGDTLQLFKTNTTNSFSAEIEATVVVLSA